MKLPPIDVLMTFPHPNYVNPETSGDALLVVNSVFVALAALALILRLYTRLVVLKFFGWDDTFITIAFVSKPQ
jgi:hypothetical protein